MRINVVALAGSLALVAALVGFVATILGGALTGLLP